MVSKRPQNILYLMTDQQKASAAGFLGNPLVPTPFMDNMAQRGVVFENAYAASSICTPSRCSVFTGVHPLVHQVTCHQNRAPHNLPQLSEILMSHGYYTAVAGHYEPERNLTRGWHEQVSYREPRKLLASVMLQHSSGRKDVGWSAGALPCSAEEGNAHLLTDRVIRMIDQMRLAGSPYFLHVAYDDPHPPYYAPPPYDSTVDSRGIPLPERGDGSRTPLWQREVQSQVGTHLAGDDDVRRAIAVYYGKIAYADAQMERVCRALQERDLLRNTWIIISSDHGDYTGEKGLFSKSESLYECLLHVPLIIVPPEEARFPRGKRTAELVDTTDVFSTVLGIAGISAPEYAQSRDLLPWVADGAQSPFHECLFAQVGDYHGHLKTTLPGGIPEAGRHAGLVQGARTKELSFVSDPDNGDEAYDLRRDPRELNNLLADGRGEAAEVAGLRKRLEAWETECLNLRRELKIIPGYRGFDEGWE